MLHNNVPIMTIFRILKKTSIILLSSCLVVGCDQDSSSSLPVEELQTIRPNILLILADDLGYSDIGAFGGEISTPNLDALAMGGVRMTNLYAAAACSPTRSMLMSGVDNHRAGLGNMIELRKSNQEGKLGYEGYLNHDVVSIATLLKDAGYHTYMAGKWHLGYEDDQSPMARGFEQSFALLNGAGSHFDHSPASKVLEKAIYRENEKLIDLPEDFFSSEYYTDKMIEYLKSNENDGKPFFGYLTFTAPHWPLQAPDDYIDKYKGKYDSGYNVLREERIQRMEELGIIEADVDMTSSSEKGTLNWNGLSPLSKQIKSREMEIYAAMVDNMDYHIGRVVDYLGATAQRDNTLIIFMSDNGPASGRINRSPNRPQSWIDANFDTSFENMGKKGSYTYYDTHWTEAGVGVSRLFKGHPTEGGINVPGIINYPGKLENLKGEISNELMTVLDLAPTFLELAGTEHPGTEYKGRTVIPHVGKSAASFINGTSNTIHDEKYTMVWELFNRIGIRNGDWKMTKIPEPIGTGKWELFDLKNDPGETKDIKANHQEQFQKMIKVWDDYVVENGVVLGE